MTPPVVPVEPFILKDSIFSVAADDFAAACSAITITPTAQTVTFVGLKPGAVFTDMSAAVWALALTYAQDHANADSLSNYLFDHEGETKEVTFKPQSGIGPSYTVNLVITPGAIGGTGGAVAASTVNLGVKGKPVRVPAA